MKADDLIELQVRLEYQVDGEILYPFAGSTEQSRFIAYRHPGGFLRYYRHDLPAGSQCPGCRRDAAWEGGFFTAIKWIITLHVSWGKAWVWRILRTVPLLIEVLI